MSLNGFCSFPKTSETRRHHFQTQSWKSKDKMLISMCSISRVDWRASRWAAGQSQASPQPKAWWFASPITEHSRKNISWFMYTFQMQKMILHVCLVFHLCVCSAIEFHVYLLLWTDFSLITGEEQGYNGFDLCLRVESEQCSLKLQLVEFLNPHPSCGHPCSGRGVSVPQSWLGWAALCGGCCPPRSVPVGE